MRSFNRKFLAGSMALGALGLSAMDASATRFTETAEFWLRSLQTDATVTNPPITALELQAPSGGGSLFTNTVAFPTQNTAIVRTVGIDQIAKFSNDPNDAFVISPISGHNVYVIFALEGEASLSGGGALAKFTSGKAIVMTRPAGGFADTLPATWGFDPTGANVLGVYDLAPQEDVVKGPNGDIVGSFPNDVIPASETNFSAINVGSSALNQGIFLFDFAGNGEALTTAGATQDFHVNVDPTGLPGTEGLLVISDQSNPQIAPTGFGAPDEAVLNSIMQTLLGKEFSSNADLTTLYTPNFANSGDFYNEFGFNANPTSRAAVPEPASAALGLMALAGLGLRGRRSRNA